jgi:hypothetical protein
MRRNIIFIGHPEKWNSGSSYLRSRQLGLLAKASPEFNGLNVEFASELTGRNSIQILNKYAIEHFRAEDLLDSKTRNNRLIADPLDGVFEDDLLELYDRVIAASCVQREHYLASLSKPVFYVGHHVDQRIAFLPQPPSRSAFSIAYFGEITNARFQDALSERVIFHSVDTKKSDSTDWMGRLKDHPAHYAIRTSVTERFFKPFTKGFIAAQCMAPVLVAEEDDEARRFLPDTYPYFTRTGTPGEIRTTIERMTSDFEANSPDWIFALESMRRVRGHCDPQLIVRQLHTAISPLL